MPASFSYSSIEWEESSFQSICMLVMQGTPFTVTGFSDKKPVGHSSAFSVEEAGTFSREVLSTT